jgi:hypothetical protein
LKYPDVDPSSRNNLLLRKLSWDGETKIIKILLQDPRVNPSDCNNQALVMAMESMQYEVVNVLLNNPKIILKEMDIVSIFGHKPYKPTPIYTKCLNMLFSSKQIDPLSSKIPSYIIKNTLLQQSIRYAVRDKWSGALAGWFYVTSEDPSKKISNALYNNFLKYLIRNKASILNAVTKLQELSNISNADNKVIVNKAAHSILIDKPINNLTKFKTDIFHSLKGFLLLSYTPVYTFFEILDIMKKSNASKDALSLTGKLLGAYLGLEVLTKQGLKLTSNITKRVKTITESNMSCLYGN